MPQFTGHVLLEGATRDFVIENTGSEIRIFEPISGTELYKSSFSSLLPKLVAGQDYLFSDAAIQVGDVVGTPAAGMVAWDGSNFVGYDGASWIALDTQSFAGGGGWTLDVGGWLYPDIPATQKVHIGAATDPGIYELKVTGQANVTDDLLVGGDLGVSGAGPHAFGGAVDGRYAFYLLGTHTSNGSAVEASKMRVSGTLVGASGDTSWLAGLTVNPAINTQGTGDTIAVVSTVYVNEPQIVKGAGDTITVAASLYVASAPTEGVSNYAFMVGSGASRFAGAVTMASTLGVTGAATFSSTLAIGASGLTIGTTVTISESAANTLALGSGDSLSVTGGGYIAVTEGWIQSAHTTSTNTVFRAFVTGDSYVRWSAAASGALSWGSGAGAADVTLSRGAADRLDLGIGDGILMRDGAITFSHTTAVSAMFYGFQSGEGTARFAMLANGTLQWGDGTLTRDVTLSRGAANRLDLGSGDYLRFTGATTGANVVEGFVSGDTAVRWYMTAGGTLNLGDGAGTWDTTLSRGAANRLDLGSGDSLYLSGAGGINIAGTGTLVVAGAGPHAIGGATANYVQTYFRGSFTSGGASTVAFGTAFNTALTGATGDTGCLAQAYVWGSITTQGATEVIGVVAGLRVDEPAITVGTGDTVSNAASLYIPSAPTEGTLNYALFVDAGSARFDGGVVLGADGALTAGQAEIFRSSTNGTCISAYSAASSNDFSVFSAANGTGSPVIAILANSDDLVFERGGGGKVLINDTANANMTVGLTINQGAADDEILALKSSDVAHGVTTVMETDTYSAFKKASAADGGLSIVAVREGTTALAMAFTAVAPVDDTTKTTAGRGVFELYAQKINGTGVQAVGADGNLLCLKNNTSTAFIFDAEGSAHADVEWVTF